MFAITKTLIILAVMLPVLSISQDIHFTNNNFALTHFNPSSTGDFRGNLRVSAITRDQYSSFFTDGYKTSLISIDSPLALGIGPLHWVGIGGHFYTDKAGGLALRRKGYSMNGAYHIAFDKKYENVFTIGVSYGILNHDLDDTGAKYADPDDPVDLNNFAHGQNDLTFGVKYKARLSKTSSFQTGLSYARVLTSNKSNVNNDLVSRLNFHIESKVNFTKTLTVNPQLYYSKSSFATNFNLHILSEIRFNKKSNFIFRPGIGMRFGDALNFHMGGDYQSWRLNISYDLTTSSASIYNNNVGGIEVGIQRIFVIHKKPKVKTILICPRL